MSTKEKGIIERMREANKSTANSILLEAKGYKHISPKTKRKLAKLYDQKKD